MRSIRAVGDRVKKRASVGASPKRSSGRASPFRHIAWPCWPDRPVASFRPRFARADESEIDSLQHPLGPLGCETRQLQPAKGVPVQLASEQSFADAFGSRISAEGLRDYWAVYLANRHEIESAVMQGMMASPALRPLVAPLSAEVWETERRASTKLIERALDGDWSPYIARVQRQGAQFAANKVPFRSWYLLLLELRQKIVPLLVGRFRNDVERLTRALNAANEYIDLSMALLSDAYLQADRLEIQRERARTQKHVHALDVFDRLLRKRTAILEAVLGTMRDGVALCTADGELPVVNDAARALLHLVEQPGTPVRWLGPVEGAWLQADGRTPLPNENHPVSLALSGTFARDQKFVKRDGPEGVAKHLVVDSSPLYLDDTLVGALVVFRDVTERRKMSQLLRRSEELEKENAIIETASRLKSEFFANMSHELRTPLNAILGFSELIYDGVAGPTTPTQLEYLDDILMSGRHLLTLINDVLDLAKVEAGRLQLHPETVDVSLLAQEVISVLQGAATQGGVDLHLVAPAPRHAYLDPSRVRQVLYNYLSNAIKFTPKNGRVSVRIESAQPNAVRIAVQDTGIGIAADDISRIFREFEQLQSASARSGTGTGLGLALTRNLVEAMGGTVSVESVLGEGSTFYAVLPTSLDGEHSTLPNRSLPGMAWNSPRVLVVQEEPENQNVLVRMLTEAGYAVTTASTGVQACQLAGDEKFDAIVLDWRLPDSSSAEVLETIRGNGANATTPLLLVYVSAAEESTVSFAVSGVISKPLDRETLKDALVSAGVPSNRRFPILVVDDDDATLRLAEASLKQLGYDPACFAFPNEALSWLESNEPGAVILDLVMPEIDGFAFLHRMDAMRPGQRVPVFVWSVKDLSAAELEVFRNRARTTVLEGKRTGNGLLRELSDIVTQPNDGSSEW